MHHEVSAKTVEANEGMEPLSLMANAGLIRGKFPFPVASNEIADLPVAQDGKSTAPIYSDKSLRYLFSHLPSLGPSPPPAGIRLIFSVTIYTLSIPVFPDLIYYLPALRDDVAGFFNTMVSARYPERA